jgi:rhomboid protease GluP
MFIVLTAVGVNILEPEPLDLMAWGGNFRAARIEGEWWRLITGSFLHNGFIQFALNMYALIAIGWMIEPQIGKANFLGAYLSAAVVSGMTNLLWLDDATVSTGAAGAIFGVYGVFMAYTLLTGLKPGMSNSANVAGMVTGMLIGYCLYPVLLQPEGLVRKYITLGVIILVLGGSTALAYRSLPGGDMAEYQERIREFAELNKKAIDVLYWPAGTDEKKVIREIKSISIPTLDQQIKILKKVEQLSVPEETKERARQLMKYCIYRIKVYQLKLRILEGKSKDIARDENEITYYTARIDAIVDDFESEFDILTKSI